MYFISNDILVLFKNLSKASFSNMLFKMYSVCIDLEYRNINQAMI